MSTLNTSQVRSDQKVLKARRYLIEEPSSSDDYETKAHTYVAGKVTAYIKSDQCNIVGVEGELGAGKSTIVNLVKNELSSDEDQFVIHEFHADRHAQSLKASLISELYDSVAALQESQGGQKTAEDLKKSKRRALGREYFYKKDTVSKMSWWTLSFILLVILSAAFSAPAMNVITSNLYEFDWGKYEFSFAATFLVVLFLSPAVHLIIYGLLGYRQKELSTAQRYSNLIKKNSGDEITESIGLDKGLISTELKDELSSLVDFIGVNQCLLLVIDNIDRLSGQHAAELWGDLDVLVGLSKDKRGKLKILLPYCAKELAAALGGTGMSQDYGFEYITKKVPISYKAPPAVSYHWRELFNKYWDDVLSDINGRETAADLVNILYRNEKITPRSLKYLVNSVGLAVDSCPESDIHGGVCAAYVLAGQGQQLKSVGQLISKHESSDSSAGRIQRVLNRDVSNEDDWVLQVACLHYKCKKNVAKSELIVDPMEAAVRDGSAEALFELSSIHGFNHEFRHYITDRGNYVYLLPCLAKMLNIAGGLEFLHAWIGVVNDFWQRQTSPEIFHDGLTEAIEELARNEFLLDVEPLEGLECEYRNRVKTASESTHEDLLRLHRLNKLTGNRTVSLNDMLPAEVFYPYVYQLRSMFSIWEIDSWEFEEEEINLAINYFTKTGVNAIVVNDFIAQVIRHGYLGWGKSSSFLVSGVARILGRRENSKLREMFPFCMLEKNFFEVSSSLGRLQILEKELGFEALLPAYLVLVLGAYNNVSGSVFSPLLKDLESKISKTRLDEKLLEGYLSILPNIASLRVPIVIPWLFSSVIPCLESKISSGKIENDAVLEYKSLFNRLDVGEGQKDDLDRITALVAKLVNERGLNGTSEL